MVNLFGQAWAPVTLPDLNFYPRTPHYMADPQVGAIHQSVVSLGLCDVSLSLRLSWSIACDLRATFA